MKAPVLALTQPSLWLSPPTCPLDPRGGVDHCLSSLLGFWEGWNAERKKPTQRPMPEIPPTPLREQVGVHQRGLGRGTQGLTSAELGHAGDGCGRTAWYSSPELQQGHTIDVLPPDHCQPFLSSTSGDPNIYINGPLADGRAVGKAYHSVKSPGTEGGGLKTLGGSPLCPCPSSWEQTYGMIPSPPGLLNSGHQSQCSSSVCPSAHLGS